MVGTAVPSIRPNAEITALDITKWFGETSGGVRTYLQEKVRYVEATPELRHVLVIPGRHDAVRDGDGVRTYELSGPRIPTQRAYRFMLATDSISRIVERERPDIIEVGSPFFVPWVVRPAAKRNRIPLVSFYHSNFPRQMGGLETVGWRYLRTLNKLFHTTVVASEFSANELYHAGIERTVRVPLGVDLQHFHPKRQADRTATCTKFGIPDGPVAIYVGRFAKEKQIEVIVKGWGDVARRTGAHLLLVGDGPRAKQLAALSDSSKVCILPYQRDRSNLADIIAACDLYIAPGTQETFGLAALEALASGVPVLSCDAGAVPEQVRSSGAGSLYPPGDSGAFAEEAIRLLQSPDLATLGARGRDYAEREHAWHTIFDRIFAVYRDVLSSAA